MSENTITRDEYLALVNEVKGLRDEVTRLRGLVPEIPEDVVQIIAVAVAAYLGAGSKIRFIRRRHQEPEGWQSGGHTSVMASRTLQTKRGI